LEYYLFALIVDSSAFLLRMTHKLLHFRYCLIALAILFCVSTQGIATAAEQCEAVRPPGLSSQEAEQTVLMKISAALEIPAAKIDVTRSVQDLAGADNAMMRYAIVAVYVGDALGFDAGAAFDKAAKSKGKVHPSQSLTIAELQVLARQSYLSTPDMPYPSAKPDAIYKTRRFVASAPTPPSGWKLIKCNYNQFAFQRQDTKSGDVSNASASDVKLEPFEGNAEFLNQVRASAKSVTPSNMTVTLLTAEMLEQSGAPCALLEIQGKALATTVDNIAVKQLPMNMFARFCYGTKFPQLGHIALYSNVGNLSQAAVRQEAFAFFAGIMPTQ
jgi:hypothetical protein